jgi:hypothetical protein
MSPIEIIIAAICGIALLVLVAGGVLHNFED